MIALMPGTNLTRSEAATRADLLDVTSYAIDLDLTTGAQTFVSTTILRFSCTQPGAETFADLIAERVLEIQLNGRALDPSTAYADGRIALDELALDNELVVRAECAYTNTGEGLHRFVDPADERIYTYSQFEVPDARRVFTTFEQPDLKSVFTFTVTTPPGWVVASNSPAPTPEQVGEALVWRFAETQRMSTYITAVVAGEYHYESDTYVGPHGEIPLRFYCRQSLKPYLDTDELVTITKQSFAFFEEQFAFPYPWGKYDQIFVPEYNMGAMENAGCVTFRDEYLPRSRQPASFFEFRTSVITHEMAHMWFGNLVTMKWWDDLWLNESFAEWACYWCEAEATAFSDAWTGFANARKLTGYRADQLPSTHPIAADNPDLHAVEVNFDMITYAKGASVLKQLVAWVGLEGFIAGIRQYFRDHAFGNTDFSDLLGALEKASGRELAGWAQEWLQTAGVNTLAADFEVDAEGRYTSFAVRQSAAPDYPTLRRHRLGIGLYDWTEATEDPTTDSFPADESKSDDSTTNDSTTNDSTFEDSSDDSPTGYPTTARRLLRRDYLELDVAGESTPVPDLMSVRRPDLLLLNDGDHAFAKIRLDPKSLATATAGLSKLDDSLARALLWGSMWEMVREAELAPAEWVELVIANVGEETDAWAVTYLVDPTKARQITQWAVDRYTAPSARPAVARRWEQGLREQLLAAPSGSDHQLTFARAYAFAAVSERAVAEVVALLDGTWIIEGLVVDQDLRWVLLTALAGAGRIGDAEVDAELARDQSISGQEHAAEARASQPSPEAKDAAWRAVCDPGTPNETAFHAIRGMFRSCPPELAATYVDRWLEFAPRAVEVLGFHKAANVLEFGFPLSAASPEVLERLDAWLAQSDIPNIARRFASEARAEVARTLAIQAGSRGSIE